LFVTRIPAMATDIREPPYVVSHEADAYEL
jgi:hypothetical protein